MPDTADTQNSPQSTAPNVHPGSGRKTCNAPTSTEYERATEHVRHAAVVMLREEKRLIAERIARTRQRRRAKAHLNREQVRATHTKAAAMVRPRVDLHGDTPGLQAARRRALLEAP